MSSWRTPLSFLSSSTQLYYFYIENIFFDHRLIFIEYCHVLHFIFFLVLENFAMGPHEVLLDQHEIGLEDARLQSSYNLIEEQIVLTSIRIYTQMALVLWINISGSSLEDREVGKLDCESIKIIFKFCINHLSNV